MRALKVVVILVFILCSKSAELWANESNPSLINGAKMKISGTFEVNLKPLESYAEGKGGVSLARMSIDKTFHGALDATSQGEMLSAMTAVQGSAGYVAIEQVEGSLSGKKGSFVLQHSGSMNGGDSNLVLEVVPDSGAGELTGLTGAMAINIEDGQHHYEFVYELP